MIRIKRQHLAGRGKRSGECYSLYGTIRSPWAGNLANFCKGGLPQ